MTLDDFYFLLTESGQKWLADTAVPPVTPQNHLQIAARLRQELSPSQAQAVLETVLLRQKAAVKFSRAERMFFTRAALEQASSEVVSGYRAERFRQAGCQRVADLGCGIGGDALALAAEAEVTGVEWDPLRLAMAQENARVYGHGGRFHPLQADLPALTPFAVDGVFFDPGRRDEQGRRFYSVRQYQPPLALVDRWREVAGYTAVKVSPGIHYEEIPPDAEIEFISLRGEVKEGVLWYEGFRTGTARRATLLPGGHTLTSNDLPEEETAVTPPKTYLYEPDGAVIRAHLVQALARQLNATLLDPEIAYLTGDVAQETPFARRFRLEDALPFQLKRLRRYLQERNVGRVTIKKRGSPLEPDKLRRQLRLRGDRRIHRILFLTQVRGEAAVLIGQEERNQ
ncbi:MAG TPA: class I SAM-dependent methyltransferase [Anaerolineae bacterium]|nr:class I SAM-dependent methyltransferase [Anaerolineae bacterium]